MALRKEISACSSATPWGLSWCLWIGERAAAAVDLPNGQVVEALDEWNEHLERHCAAYGGNGQPLYLKEAPDEWNDGLERQRVRSVSALKSAALDSPDARSNAWRKALTGGCTPRGPKGENRPAVVIVALAIQPGTRIRELGEDMGFIQAEFARPLYVVLWRVQASADGTRRWPGLTWDYACLVWPFRQVAEARDVWRARRREEF